MDVIAAYQSVGTHRGAAELRGTTHKMVRRIVQAHQAGEPVERKDRGHNYDAVADLVAARVEKTQGRISAKRLLPAAMTAGYAGSPRNFRRLVADAKQGWRRGHHRGRRPGVWSPGETLLIDWGMLAGLHVFCAVLGWSRFRFVRFAGNEKASTTFELLAECFEVLGGVPQVVLADRMGCLKAGVVANVVVPTPDYVRLATHYGFRPDFCHGADPQSKGMVENLVGYAKSDLIVPQQPFTDLWSANDAAQVVHRSERHHAFGDLRGPAGAAAGGAGAAAAVAVAAAGVRGQAGVTQGRPAVVYPVRVGPLLGAVPADRAAG